MKVIKPVTEETVFSHWQKVEKMDNWPAERVNIVSAQVGYPDVDWYLAELEIEDIKNMFIISSDDWSQDGLCVPDFRLTTAINNFVSSPEKTEKHRNIKQKQSIFKKDITGLDTKLIIVAPRIDGPFTVIEGNKRSVALGSLRKLDGQQVYLGISPAIRNYLWARYANNTAPSL